MSLRRSHSATSAAGIWRLVLQLSLLLVALQGCREPGVCEADGECLGAQICRSGSCQKVCTSDRGCAPGVCRAVAAAGKCACDTTHACDPDCSCDLECRYCQSTDPAAATLTERASSRTTVSVLGAMLDADGVQVTIPPGAARQNHELTLTVFDEGAITLWPPLELDMPAVISLPPDRWPAEVGGVVLARDGDSVAHVGNFTAGMFTVDRLATFVPIELDGTGGRWALGDFYPDKPEWEVVDHGKLRSFDSGCLVAMAAIDDRHDPVQSSWWGGKGRHGGEAFQASREVAESVERLSDLLQDRLRGLGDYRLWLNGAWDSSRSRKVRSLRGRRSHHDAGAAVDLVPCRMSRGRCTKVTDLAEEALMGITADLAVEAGFDWVWYEDPRHIHASRTSPSVFRSGCKR